MIQAMRNNVQGVIAKIIVGLIIIVFALWGVESIVGMGSGDRPSAVVNGEDISEVEVVRLVEQQKTNLRRQFGEQFDETMFNDQLLRESALEQLIEQKVAVVQAKEMGLRASTRAVDETIVSIPAFQLDGRFSREQFQNILRMNGISPMAFRASLSEDIITNQLRAALVLSSIEVPYSAKLIESLLQEKRSFRYVEVGAQALEKGIRVTDEEIAEAYEAQRDRFYVPEKVRIQYVELKRTDVASRQHVDDDEIEQAYNEYVEREAVRETRNASHLLIEVSAQRSAEEALALAKSLHERALKGENFAALVKEYSDDIASRATGGVLGFTARNGFDEAFADALFSLKKQGEISAPVQTEFGYHIIRLEGIMAAKVKTLAQMKDELTRDIREAKSAALFAEQVQELSNLAFSASDINEVASGFNLSVQTSDWFSRESGAGVANNSQVRQAAFSESIMLDRNLSTTIESDDGVLVLAVTEHTDATTQPLSDVKDQVAASLVRDRAVQLAKERAAAIAANPDGKVDWKRVTTDYQTASDAPRAVQQRAFAASLNVAETVPTANGFAALVVDSIERSPWQDMPGSVEAVEAGRVLNSREDMTSYQVWARTVSKVKIN